MSSTLYYGKDAQGNPVYESSTAGGVVNPSTAITSAALSPQQAVKLPPSPAPTNFNGAVANGSAVIGANNVSLTPANSPTTGEDNLTSLFDKYLSSAPKPPSASETYSSLYASSGIDPAQTDLNAKNAAVVSAQGKLKGITAQIEGLNAEATAASLQQDNRQAPTFAIAGEQGAIDRSRAIKAIPLQVQALAAQAEVASAQGDATLSASILTQAKDHLDTLFKLTMDDATNPDACSWTT